MFVAVYASNEDDKVVASSNNKFLQKYSNKLLTLIEDPDNHFLIADDTLGQQTMKFLHAKGFRKCTLYHLDQQPSSNIARYKTIGKFSSRTEMIAEILGRATAFM